MTRIHPAIRPPILHNFRSILYLVRIVILGISILTKRRESKLIREILHITQERTRITKRTYLQLGSKMRIRIFRWHTNGLDIQNGRS